MYNFISQKWIAWTTDIATDMHTNVTYGVSTILGWKLIANECADSVTKVVRNVIFRYFLVSYRHLSLKKLLNPFFLDSGDSSFWRLVHFWSTFTNFRSFFGTSVFGMTAPGCPLGVTRGSQVKLHPLEHTGSPCDLIRREGWALKTPRSAAADLRPF